MLLMLDLAGETPLYLQIRNQIVRAIASGELSPGERLPSIRSLAEQSGVNMMTVSKAYTQLKQEGYIEADRRYGTVVAGQRAHRLTEKSVESLYVIAGEARIAGMSEEEFLSLCREAFGEGGERK